MTERPVTPERLAGGDKGKRGPCTFRERDVRAAIRAAEAAGKKVVSAKITRSGEIEVIFGSGEIVAENTNPWDEED